MAASTLFFWLRLPSIAEKYKSAMAITGLVTFIAAYHYFRIFNSWVGAYSYPAAELVNNGTSMLVGQPMPTGTPFNDAYRYMDWLLTVPLLLITILLVINPPEKEYSSKAWTLGFSSAHLWLDG